MIQFHTTCIGCGKCVWDCFPGAISMDAGKPCLKNPEACIGCGHCIAICPRNAVYDETLPTVSGEKPDLGPDKLLELMRFRRSCRHYTQEPVTEDQLQTLLEAARACPTAKNLQATRFIAVREQIPTLLDAALEGLGQVGLNQRETATDPSEKRRAENFILWANTRSQDKGFDPLFFHAPLLLLFVSEADTARDAASAAAYTELMAASMGLGCLYSGYFTACCAGSPKLQALLKLSPKEQVVRCLVLGHPDVKFLRPAPRKPVELTHM
jgi:nitroreductase